MKTIIEKIELDSNNQIINIPIGYTYDIELINKINNSYDLTLGKFSKENKTDLENGEVLISKFFDTIDHTFEARLQTDSDSKELTEITNINQI